MKKRLFVSQPMSGKTPEEILAVREHAVRLIEEQLGEEVELIDSSFFDDSEGINPLFHLGKALELLSTADIAFFAYGWDERRGCCIEHECATQYGIDTIVYDYCENQDGRFYTKVYFTETQKI